ncbi:MAG: clostripain-related cysteine peptidase [Eubacteriales bacterium]|nr:clostripain-related cysteine peptidase [Eubacteriales bacterium]
MDNRPRSREKHVTNGSKGVNRRGSGLGTGPVGSGNRLDQHQRDSGSRRSSGGGRSPFSLIIILIIALLGGKSFLGGNFNFDENDTSSSTTTQAPYYQSASVTSSWAANYPQGVLNRNVASEAREKRTAIRGNGKDTVTLMVYMCGTDLESRHGMATSDLQEMASANISDKVNIIVFTGGCAQWKNNVISSRVNQIYQVKKGGLSCLNKDAGNTAMTDPNTLSSFIRYCKKNFPADRNELILWDHGGGSVSGYGYDEKKAATGSMNLSGIRAALENAGMKFDFIGFDACLMATVENALMLNDYADYLIASEETEPGIGWFYTNWLNELSKDTSIPTIELGKTIIDDYVSKCAQKCPGQGTTLSIVDLAELSQTVPANLTGFATSTSALIENNQYKQVSDARYRAKEYAPSTKIDQIDLVDFAVKMKTKEGKQLADSIANAVKYNLTSRNMANSYGLSIYFPYRKTNKVDSAVKTYQAIGMDDEYSRCIMSFAKMEVSGQAVSAGTPSPYPTLSGSSAPSNMDSQAMIQILQALMGGNVSSMTQSMSGLNSNNIGFLTGRSISDECVEDYVTENQINVEDLRYSKSGNNNVLKLTEDQWSMVHDLVLNMFYDDGSGYVDLGLDNTFEFDKHGDLIAKTDHTWLAIDEQPVAYYYESTYEEDDNYTITGHVPAFLNGERVNLILVFDNENPYGYIAGANTDYQEDVTDVCAKNLIEVKAGDQLDFICDYYTYDGAYQDSYYLGDTLTLTDDTLISNVDVGEGEVSCSFRITDIYNQTYWTPAFN